jgi:transcriptional regulator with GAF, ATPase, and Fis domain/anti-anti-sigma regulatory factor
MHERVAQLEASETEYERALTEARQQAAQHERRAIELAIVNETGQNLASVMELDELLEAVHRQVSRLFDTTNFYIATYEDGNDIWTSAFHIEHGQRQPRAQYKIETGITGHIIRNRQPLLWRSAEEGMALIKAHKIQSIGEQARSWLGVPFIAADKVVGMMAIQSYEQDDLYSEQDLILFSTVAAQVAPALANMRLLEETRRRTREMEIINELGRALTARLNLDQVLEEAHRQTARLVDTTNFYIALYDLDEDEITFALDVTEGELRRPYTTRRAGQGLTEYIIRNRTSLLIEEDLIKRLEGMGIELIGTPAFSWLGVPLMIGDRVLGVMAVQSYTTPRAYDEHDQDLLTAIASQTAIALQNARLYEAAEQELAERKRAEDALQRAYAEVEKQIKERTAELQQEVAERERLQQEVIEAQRRALQELSTPIIPLVERIIVMPLIGSIDSMRARDITRSLLAGIREHRAKILILDITGVPLVDSGVADHLNKTIQAARLKGARTIVTGISDAVAETIVDLGIDWGGIETLSDLQTGLIVALDSLGIRLTGSRTPR